MKYEIKDLVLIRTSIHLLANEIRKGKIPYEDLEYGTRISNELKTAVDTMGKWVADAVPVEFRLLRFQGLKVNNKGQVFDVVTDKEYTQVWRDGDMRIDIHGDIRRVVPIVASAFHVSAPAPDSFIPSFKNGDRRDLRPENICWIRRELQRRDFKQLLHEDICRRIVDTNGDVDKIMEYYVDSKPAVSRELVESIINKEINVQTSDAFFNNIGGRITRVTQSKTATGFDVYGCLIQFHDWNLCENILKDKVRDETLSDQEETIMIISISPDIDKHPPEWYSEQVKEKWGYDIIPARVSKLLAEPVAKEIKKIREEKK